MWFTFNIILRIYPAIIEIEPPSGRGVKNIGSVMSPTEPSHMIWHAEQIISGFSCTRTENIRRQVEATRWKVNQLTNFVAEKSSVMKPLQMNKENIRQLPHLHMFEGPERVTIFVMYL